jgi:hypothetical protein
LLLKIFEQRLTEGVSDQRGPPLLMWEACPELGCRATRQRLNLLVPKALVEKRRGFHAPTDGARRIAPSLQPDTEILKNTAEDRQRTIAGVSVGKQ